ncbi:hypothetical protein KIPB_008147, partial [Kipferlia bialata]|eukprot:g8147.t1
MNIVPLDVPFLQPKSCVSLSSETFLVEPMPDHKELL